MRGNPELLRNLSGTVTLATDHMLCPYMGLSLISKYWGGSECLGCAGVDRWTSGEVKGSWEQVPRVSRKLRYERGEQKWVSKLIFKLRDIQEK